MTNYVTLLSLFSNHYAKTSMEYALIFKGCKNDICLDKNMIFFCIIAQNIDCGYSTEPPHILY